MENCDKSIMREGRKNRRLGIDLIKLSEFDAELKLSEFQLALTDLFVVMETTDPLSDKFSVQLKEMKKTGKILIPKSYPTFDHTGLTTVLPENSYPFEIEMYPGFSRSPIPDRLQYCRHIYFCT